MGCFLSRTQIKDPFHLTENCGVVKRGFPEEMTSELQRSENGAENLDRRTGAEKPMGWNLGKLAFGMVSFWGLKEIGGI